MHPIKTADSWMRTVSCLALFGGFVLGGSLPAQAQSTDYTADQLTAINNLVALVELQEIFRAKAYVDDDLDGNGEYGTIEELSGLVPLNWRANGNGPNATIDQPLIIPTGLTFRYGAWVAGAYAYVLYLPDAVNSGLLPWPFLPSFGFANFANFDADQCEQYWSCYAFPVSVPLGVTSESRTFFVDYRGTVIETKMDAIQYAQDPATTLPTWDSALNGIGGDMNDPLGIAVGVLSTSVDGNAWYVVR